MGYGGRKVQKLEHIRLAVIEPCPAVTATESEASAASRWCPDDAACACPICFARTAKRRRFIVKAQPLASELLTPDAILFLKTVEGASRCFWYRQPVREISSGRKGSNVTRMAP